MTPSNRFAPRRSASGFTLVEILVSSALSSIVLLGVFALLGGSLSLFSRTRNTIEQSAETRFALNRLSADLTGAFIRPGSMQFVENAPSLFNGAPPHSESDQNEALFVVTAALNSGPGDLCIAAYRLNRDTLTIERAFVDSTTAWQTSPRYLASAYSSMDWTPLVEDVTAFELHCYTEAEIALPALPPTPATMSWDSESDGIPALAVIAISQIDHPTAQRIKEDGGLEISDSELPQPTTHTRFLTFPQSP